jgi:hypothetical protein
MGTHYYARDGSPRYTVLGANGAERDSTLRDARVNGWLPSVTQIIDTLAKPGLVNWRIDQAILATLTLPKDPEWTEAEYLKRIKSDAGKQAWEAAAEGTRIHDALEKHYKGERYDERYRKHVNGAVAEIEKSFPEVLDWQAEKSFSHPSGYGGRADIHSRAVEIVLDAKSKDLAPDDNDRLAFDQFIQLAACAEGLGIGSHAKPPILVSLFISRTHPGHARLHRWEPEDYARGLRIFHGALDAWKASVKYECGWVPS